MFGLQPQDLLIILIVALLIFGPSRLPEIGKALGKTIREFQAGIKATPEAQSTAIATKPQSACKACGKPILTTAKFCTECGAPQT